jgi:hypothetical protein
MNRKLIQKHTCKSAGVVSAQIQPSSPTAQRNQSKEGWGAVQFGNPKVAVQVDKSPWPCIGWKHASNKYRIGSQIFFGLFSSNCLGKGSKTHYLAGP